MTRGRLASRDPGRLRLLVVLALAILVAPLESGLLPGPLDHLVAESPARALSPFVEDGLLADCDDGWSGASSFPDAADVAFDLCEIVADACPYSQFDPEGPFDPAQPLDPTRQMGLSTQYPEFCEETVTSADQPTEFAACETLANLVVIVDAGNTTCRVLQLRACLVGARIGPDKCRARRRRSWSCPQANAIPRNEFNSCYILPDTPAEPVDACGPGAPEFNIVDCVEYVGGDFVASVPCASYVTGDGVPDMEENSANRHWCKFNPSYLKVECHGGGDRAPCDDPTALCIKRRSGTGGCASIARVMLCRSLQAQYDPDDPDGLPAWRVRSEGCEPCLILPFEPTPAGCPEDSHAEPVYDTLVRDSIDPARYQLLRQERDIEFGTRACGNMATYRDVQMPHGCSIIETRCERPGAGNPMWRSTHLSGVAVINAPVIVTVLDVPTRFRPDPDFEVLSNTLALDWSDIDASWAEYPGSGGDLVRTFKPPILDDNDGDPTDDSTSDVFTFGNQATECVVEGLPAFKLVVEELWPDKPEDAVAIREMFGAHTLAWWDLINDPDVERQRTRAHGLERYWPDLSTVDEQAARDAALETTIDCNVEQDTEVWCRWHPARAGYYTLKVAGAWLMTAKLARGWKEAHLLRQLRTAVDGLDDDDRTRIRATLGQLGCGPNVPVDDSGIPLDDTCAWTPQMIGLNSTLTDILPTGPEDVLTADISAYAPKRSADYLYDLPGDSHRFGGPDLRVVFTDRGWTGTYTETDEFGIQVHEVRVTTVTPAR